MSDIISTFFDGGTAATNPNLNGLNTLSSYRAPKTSYSGCDIVVSVTDPRSGLIKIIGNLSTLAYSIHREKFPVRGLGRTYPKTYCRGPRTLAGTLVFSVFDRYALYDIASVKAKLDNGVGEDSYSLLGDQMSPFNITCSFINELGQYSVMHFRQVELVDESATLSINDIYIEEVHSFVCGDIDVMYPFGQGPLKPSVVPLTADINGQLPPVFDANTGVVTPAPSPSNPPNVPY